MAATSSAAFPPGSYSGAVWPRVRAWVGFSADYARVVARGIQPLVTPPPVDDRSATDIAFAASVVVDAEGIWLYYSLEDRRLARALIRRS